MNCIFKYDHLFFTEESKEGNLNNLKFWNLLSDFDNKHPEAGLTVIHYLKWERPLGKYAEYLDFYDYP